MDDKTARHLQVLNKVNEALVTGLQTAIFLLEKVDDLSRERRNSIIASLRRLVAESEDIYGKEPVEH